MAAFVVCNGAVGSDKSDVSDRSDTSEIPDVSDNLDESLSSVEMVTITRFAWGCPSGVVGWRSCDLPRRSVPVAKRRYALSCPEGIADGQNAPGNRANTYSQFRIRVSS